MENEWADDWVRKLKERRGAASVKDGNFHEKQRIKKEQGPHLWGEVRQWLYAKCRVINDAMNAEVLRKDPEPAPDPEKVNLIFQSERGLRRLRVHFDSTMNCLICECLPSGAKQQKWEMSVDENGKAFFGRGEIPSNPELIAEQILDALLNGYTKANSAVAGDV